MRLVSNAARTYLLVFNGATGHDLRVLSTSATRIDPLPCVVMAGADVRLTAHGLRPVHALPPPAHRCCCCCTSLGCGPCSLRALRPRPPHKISRRIWSTSSLLYAYMTAAAATAATPPPSPAAAVAAAAAVVSVEDSVSRPITQPSRNRRRRRRHRSFRTGSPVVSSSPTVVIPRYNVLVIFAYCT